MSERGSPLRKAHSAHDANEGAVPSDVVELGLMEVACRRPQKVQNESFRKFSSLNGRLREDFLDKELAIIVVASRDDRVSTCPSAP